MCTHMPRRAEPEVMNPIEEATAYACADFAEVNAAFVTRLLELAGPLAVARTVDLGAGPADIPLRIARERPGWGIVAVEASRAMLDFARQALDATEASRRITLVRADAKATPLAGGSFDVLFSNSILHHVTDTDALWAEVKRLARPGALVFFRDLARPESEAAARRIVDTYATGEPPLLQEEYYRSLLSAYTTEEVRRQLARTDLGTFEVTRSSDRHLDISGRL